MMHLYSQMANDMDCSPQADEREPDESEDAVRESRRWGNWWNFRYNIECGAPMRESRRGPACLSLPTTTPRPKPNRFWESLVREVERRTVPAGAVLDSGGACCEHASADGAHCPVHGDRVDDSVIALAFGYAPPGSIDLREGFIR